MTRLHRRLLGMVLAASVLLGLMVSFAPQPVQAQQLRGSWLATFYNTQDFTGTPVASNVQYPSGLNFQTTGQLTDGFGAPINGLNVNRFSGIFTSSNLNFTVTGNYQFFLFADDVAEVYLDNNLILNDAEPSQSGNQTVTLFVEAGIHSMQVRFVDYEDQALLNLYWQLTTGNVPTSTPAGPQGPVGNVVNVQGLSLRTGPYLGASLISVLRPETAYVVTGKNSDEGIFTWYQVRAGEQVGWASGRYFIVQNAADVPEVATVFQQIADVPDTGVVAVPRAVMNLRRRPSIRTETIRQIEWGEPGQLIGRTVQGGQNFWFYVRYGEDEGWIYAPYVRVDGFIEVVPVY